MSIATRELYTSSSGDRWLLARDMTWGRVFVRHEANPASGGHINHIEISAFLEDGQQGPEHMELFRLIGTLVDDTDHAHHA